MVIYYHAIQRNISLPHRAFVRQEGWSVVKMFLSFFWLIILFKSSHKLNQTKSQKKARNILPADQPRLQCLGTMKVLQGNDFTSI